jgi:hypothetical protein
VKDVGMTDLDNTRAANFRNRLLRAVREVADAYDLFLILVLLLQANRGSKPGGKKPAQPLSELLSNPFVLFLVLVLLTLAFDNTQT